MKHKALTVIGLSILLAGFASANIEFDHSGDIIFQTPTQFNNDLDLNNANIQGFPSNVCPGGEAVTQINSDGTVTCGSISSTGSQNLSQVLEEGNIANQTLNMDGNNITNIQVLESFFTSACSSGEAVTEIQDDGTVVCSAVSGSTSGLSEVLEVNNTANQSIEFSNGIEIGSGAYVNEGDADNGIAIGQGSQADAGGATGQGIAIGFGATSGDSYATAVGPGSSAQPYGSSAFGMSSEVTGAYAMALGRDSSASGTASTALGYAGSASSEGAVAIGYQSNAPNAYEATFGNLNGQELDVNVTGNATIHENLEVKGELTGVDTGGSNQGLSDVLEVNNTANQSMDMGGNSIDNTATITTESVASTGRMCIGDRC